VEAVATRPWRSERSVAWVMAVVAMVLAVFWQTTWSMVELWKSSGTYSHGFLILPAFVWLVWQRRNELSCLPVRPFWPGLAILASFGLIWLIGHLASTNAPTQLTVFALVAAAIGTVLGASWVRALAFPLTFLFFAAPIGDSLVPHLMDWTADFTVAALKLSGVPVYREGNNFSIPSGDWSVVETCSGIRYVFACLTVAALYAWTIYRSTVRRLLFIASALAIAIVANWIRAYGIVMIGHLSDNQLAIGVDHFVSGGVLFAVIMATVFSLGALWREDSAEGQRSRPADAARTSPPADPTLRNGAAVVAAAATLIVWPLISLEINKAPATTSARIADVRSRAGWIRVQEPSVAWKPHVSNPLQTRVQTFAKDGQQVSVYLATFGRPSPNSKVTSALNQLVSSDDRDWKMVQRGLTEASWRSEIVAVNSATLLGRDVSVTAWQWYWIDGTMTTSPLRAALLQVLARLRGQTELSAWVMVFTQDASGDSERPALGPFLSDMLESIDQTLSAATDPVSRSAATQN
jgi:exosortase A